MSLRATYEKAWRDHWGLADNWTVHLDPADAAIVVGQVGRMKPKSFQHEFHLSARGIPFALDALQSEREGRPWQVQSSQGVDVETAMTVDGQVPNLPWLGNAEAGLQIEFHNDSGAVAFGESLKREQVEDVDNLRSQLVNAYENGTLEVGHAVVVGRQVTGEGSIFISKESGGSATVTGAASLAASGFSPLRGEASVAVRRTSGSCAQYGLAAGSVIAFRALVLVEKGFLWWRHLTLRGLAPPTSMDYARELQSVTPDEDYYALVSG